MHTIFSTLLSVLLAALSMAAPLDHQTGTMATTGSPAANSTMVASNTTTFPGIEFRSDLVYPWYQAWFSWRTDAGGRFRDIKFFVESEPPTSHNPKLLAPAHPCTLTGPDLRPEFAHSCKCNSIVKHFWRHVTCDGWVEIDTRAVQRVAPWRLHFVFKTRYFVTTRRPQFWVEKYDCYNYAYPHSCDGFDPEPAWE